MRRLAAITQPPLTQSDVRRQLASKRRAVFFVATPFGGESRTLRPPMINRSENTSVTQQAKLRGQWPASLYGLPEPSMMPTASQ
jgi:hypothetical protein